MEKAADWIYGITAALLLSSVALQAVPKGAWQKYVKLLCGGIVILAVTAPALSLLGQLRQPSLYYERELLAAYMSGGSREAAAGGSREREEWRQEARRRQEAMLEEPLTALAAEYGFVFCSCTVRWEEAGKLEGIRLTVKRDAVGGSEPAKAGPTAEAGRNAGGSPEAQVQPVTPVEEVRRVESAGEAGERMTEGSGMEEGMAAGVNEGEMFDGAAVYEPSELRKLHEALALVLELRTDQVEIYLQREEGS